MNTKSMEQFNSICFTSPDLLTSSIPINQSIDIISLKMKFLLLFLIVIQNVPTHPTRKRRSDDRGSMSSPCDSVSEALNLKQWIVLYCTEARAGTAF